MSKNYKYKVMVWMRRSNGKLAPARLETTSLKYAREFISNLATDSQTHKVTVERNKK